MGAWLSITMLLAAAGPPVAVRPVSPKPPNGLRKAGATSGIPAADFAISATPAAITFSATNPDLAPIDSGNSTASVGWTLSGNPGTGPWNLTVQAGSPSFGNCPSVPASAITVSCASVHTHPAGSGTCSPPFTLSTSAQAVAAGTTKNPTDTFTITLNFSLADSWKYIGETSPSCSLSLSYVATVP